MGESRSSHRARRCRDCTVVKIDADEVQWRSHFLHVARLDAHGGFWEKGKSLWVSSFEPRLKKPDVGDGVSALGGKLVLFRVGGRVACRHVECSTHARHRTRCLWRSKS